MKSGAWKWAGKHPFLTTILVLSALGTIEYVVRGPAGTVGGLLGSGKPPRVPAVSVDPPPAMGMGATLGAANATYVRVYQWDGRGWLNGPAGWFSRGELQGIDVEQGYTHWTYWQIWDAGKRTWRYAMLAPNTPIDAMGL